MSDLARKLFSTVVIFFSFLSGIYAQLQPGFHTQLISNSVNYPTGFDIDHNNRIYFCEKAGKVWIIENNVKQANPIIDITEEVANYQDFGLLNIILDPEFSLNGYLYIFYSVDRHHLKFFGTPNYNPNINETGATIARLTRYKLNAANNFNSVVPGSRKIILGDSLNNGVPLTGVWHMGGGMTFGKDGSLILGIGDGAAGANYQSQAIADGIIPNNMGIGEFRVQELSMLSGKLIRINPNNGNGYPSNPFYDSLKPNSNQSKIWAIGFRNPFSINIKPETGDHLVSAGNPGEIYVGDVGANAHEEINKVDTAGANYGWPLYEGFQNIPFPNNSLNSNYTITHRLPLLQYRNGTKALIDGNIVTVGNPIFPGIVLNGSSVMVGDWYQGQSFPAVYHHSLIFGDYSPGFIHALRFNNNDQPSAIQQIYGSAGPIIRLKYNHTEDAMYYIKYGSEIGKLYYQATGNQAPTAVINADVYSGQGPLTVNLDGLSSTDPENSTLSYKWTVDGNVFNTSEVTYDFFTTGNIPGVFTVKLVVTDAGGLKDSTTAVISINNTAPEILENSIALPDSFENNGSFQVYLNAEIVDLEQDSAQLTYEWKLILHHNTHIHVDHVSTQLIDTLTLVQVPCDGNIYFYELLLTVDDGFGMRDTYSRYIYPKCNLNTIPPSQPCLSAERLSPTSFKVKWSESFDLDGILSYEVFVNDVSQGLFSNQVFSYNFNNSSNIDGLTWEIYVKARDEFSAESQSSKMVFKFDSLTNCQENVYLSDLTPTLATNGWGPVEYDKTNGEIGAGDGGAIIIDGQTYTKGFGVHANSKLEFNLNGEYLSFSSVFGVPDDRNGQGNVYFKISKDDVPVITTAAVSGSNAAFNNIISLIGVNKLTLEVIDANNNLANDHAVWADAKLNACLVNAAPSYISNLTLTENGNLLEIDWTAATDDVTSNLVYEILIDGQVIDSIVDTHYVLPSLVTGNYLIHVQARDEDSNTSTSKSLTLFIEGCPENKILQGPIDDIFSLEKDFTVHHLITASNKISGESSRINYFAGNAIELLPGFAILDNAVFEARIAGCD